VPAAAVLATTAALSASPAPAERHVRIEASMQGFTPAVVTVHRGDRVTVELIATDVVHGLFLDGYGLSVEAEPGRPATLTFTADRQGTFRFRCAVTCGALHPFLVGKLRVDPGGPFWLAVGAAILLALAGLRPVRA
jgi:heme/copper-type cytochrome/quinol oxidase subunit 2